MFFWGRHTLLRGREAGTCCSDGFPLALAKKFCRGDKIASLQHFVGLNSCVMKQVQNDLSFQCRIVYTTLANCRSYNIEMNQYQLRVHLRVLCEHTKRLVPTSCPRNMSPQHVPATCPRNVSPSACRPSKTF